MKNVNISFSSYRVPLPFIFNLVKHHSLYIAERIKIASKSTANFNTLLNDLKSIGASQMDLYLGELSPETITGQIKNNLLKADVFDKKNFLKWLDSAASNYRLITLDDNSIWTIREGNITGHYIHIHPGRYSPSTIRVKANTLKTAIIVLAYCELNKCGKFNLKIINKLRKELLSESTVKSVSKSSGIGKMISLLNSHIEIF